MLQSVFLSFYVPLNGCYSRTCARLQVSGSTPFQPGSPALLRVAPARKPPQSRQLLPSVTTARQGISSALASHPATTHTCFPICLRSLSCPTSARCLPASPRRRKSNSRRLGWAARNGGENKSMALETCGSSAAAPRALGVVCLMSETSCSSGEQQRAAGRHIRRKKKHWQEMSTRSVETLRCFQSLVPFPRQGW